MSNDFNYDSNDQELDENGLPIYSDEEEYNNGSSSQDLMDMIRNARDYTEEDDDDNDDDDDSSESTSYDNEEDVDSEESSYDIDND
jgi:hypothetical protein